MVALKYNLTIEQGSTFSVSFFALPTPTVYTVKPYASVLGRDLVSLRPTSGLIAGDLWYDETETYDARWSRWDGTTWGDITPDDLTGWSARLHLRRAYDDALPLLALTSPTVAGTGITLGGQHGSVTVDISAAQTTALDSTWSGGIAGVYDLELYDASTPIVVNRFAQGTWALSVEATHD